MEKKHRTAFFDLVRKVRDTTTKEGAPQHKISVALKKMIDQHVRKLPKDRPLIQVFLERGTLGFCEHVLETLTKDLNASFSLPKPTPKPKPVENTTVDADPEPIPTETELRAHYTGVFRAVDTRYGPSLECPPDLLKAYFTKNNDKEFPAPHVYGILALVFAEETHPPLFPLLDRLERLFSTSMVAFLPQEELAAFFLREWDGSETALLEWEARNYHAPLIRQRTQPAKKMLAHWAWIERCPVLATLTPTDLDEFLRIASHPMYATRKMNAPQVLAGMDLTLRRRLITLDSRLAVVDKDSRGENVFAFWDFSWLPEKVVRRTIVPMDAGTPALSEIKFATQYFSSTYESDEVLLWAGVVPFRVEYIRVDGSRMVQTKDMFAAHQRYREKKGWDILVAHLPSTLRETLRATTLRWITSALESILCTEYYDIPRLGQRVARSFLQKPMTSVGDVVDRTYEVVGRLHPFFPLSRHHGVLVDRIRHLYFVPEKLASLPKILLFPEYFLAKDHHRAVLDAQWDQDRETFRMRVLAQLAHDSFDAVGPSLPVVLQGMPLSRKAVHRNVHVLEDGTRTTLDNVMETWEEAFLDEDIVPGGLDTIGLLVEAPDYYRGSKNYEDNHTGVFLDGILTVPSFYPYPLYEAREEEPEIFEEEKENDDNDESSDREED